MSAYLKYTGLTDEEICLKIREVTKEWPIIQLVNTAGDQILYPNDEFKQMIVECIYVSATVPDCYVSSNPEHQFYQRVLRLYLDIIGVKRIFEP